MVTLDDRRWPLVGHRLDHIRVEGPLGQEGHVFEFGGLRLKDLDEDPPDDPTLLFRFDNSCQSLQEPLARVDRDHLEPQPVPQAVDHLLDLTLSQQTIIDEDRRQSISYCARQQGCNDR